MKDIIFKGCGTAIATPFANDEIDYLEFKKLLKFQIKNKADSIIVCGTTGESATMTTKEKTELIKLSVKTCKGKIPVIAGTGSNNTSKAVEMSKIAESLGVDGLLIVTPYYNKTTQKGLIKHYKEIASSVNIPIILYNVPSRTGVNIEPKTCLELSKIKNIDILPLDLTNPESIHQFAESFLQNNSKLDILINSAGLMYLPLKRDSRGIEYHFATNHLGHYQLTMELLPALKNAKNSRVINLSSRAQQMTPLLEDWNFEK